MNAIEPSRIYTAREVAQDFLRHSRDWFYRNRKDLEARGFPKPLPATGQPRWLGSDLLAWRETQAAPTANRQANVVDWDSVLDARLRRMRKSR